MNTNTTPKPFMNKNEAGLFQYNDTTTSKIPISEKIPAILILL